MTQEEMEEKLNAIFAGVAGLRAVVDKYLISTMKIKYTKRDLANFSGYSLRTIQEKVRLGEIKTDKQGNIHVTEVQKFMNKEKPGPRQRVSKSHSI